LWLDKKSLIDKPNKNVFFTLLKVANEQLAKLEEFKLLILYPLFKTSWVKKQRWISYGHMIELRLGQLAKMLYLKLQESIISYFAWWCRVDLLKGALGSPMITIPIKKRINTELFRLIEDESFDRSENSTTGNQPIGKNQTGSILWSLIWGRSVKTENYCWCRSWVGMKDNLANYSLKVGLKVNVKEREHLDLKCCEI